jgi:predicted nucleic acid-binding protein
VARTADFIDSNVLLYLLSANDAKADRAEALLQRRPIVSVQVLNEVTNVCRRKLRMEWPQIDQFLELARSFCKVVPLTVEVHDRARELAQRYSLSFYDACVVAAALIAGCRPLHTEDMQHGLVLDESMALNNPFAADAN